MNWYIVQAYSGFENKVAENIKDVMSKNSMESNLGEILVNYKKVLIPELNLGQLNMMIRSQFLIDTKGYNVVAGKPFKSNEILVEIEKLI